MSWHRRSLEDLEKVNSVSFRCLTRTGLLEPRQKKNFPLPRQLSKTDTRDCLLFAHATLDTLNSYRNCSLTTLGRTLYFRRPRFNSRIIHKEIEGCARNNSQLCNYVRKGKNFITRQWRNNVKIRRLDVHSCSFRLLASSTNRFARVSSSPRVQTLVPRPLMAWVGQHRPFLPANRQLPFPSSL